MPSLWGRLLCLEGQSFFKQLNIVLLKKSLLKSLKCFIWTNRATTRLPVGLLRMPVGVLMAARGVSRAAQGKRDQSLEKNKKGWAVPLARRRCQCVGVWSPMASWQAPAGATALLMEAKTSPKNSYFSRDPFSKCLLSYSGSLCCCSVYQTR